MAAAALIQFTQGATVGTVGQALFGVAGAAVDVANANNAEVASWQIELVDVPPTSALTTGVKASSDNSSTPAYSFTPDVAGGYRLVLKVWGAINRSGTATDTDIRNFGVKSAGGLYLPSAQIYPRPLPVSGSGETGSKPEENNFSGQTRGWAGSGTDGLLATTLSHVDAAAVRAIALGILAETVPVMMADGPAVIASGTVYFVAIHLVRGQVVSNLSCALQIAGSGVTLGKLGLYSAAGDLLGSTANQTTAWETTGKKTAALSSQYTVSASGLYYAAIVCIASPTMIQPVRHVISAATAPIMAPALSGGAVPYGIQAAQSDLPVSATISTAGTLVPAIWIAAS